MRSSRCRIPRVATVAAVLACGRDAGSGRCRSGLLHDRSRADRRSDYAAQTKAIIAVHIYGQPAEIGCIVAIAPAAGICVSWRIARRPRAPLSWPPRRQSRRYWLFQLLSDQESRRHRRRRHGGHRRARKWRRASAGFANMAGTRRATRARRGEFAARSPAGGDPQRQTCLISTPTMRGAAAIARRYDQVACGIADRGSGKACRRQPRLSSLRRALRRARSPKDASRRRWDRLSRALSRPSSPPNWLCREDRGAERRLAADRATCRNNSLITDVSRTERRRDRSRSGVNPRLLRALTVI